ncbi:MAG: hypothetical protein JJ992_30195, partial [Planctomycetes bacterium]|nr:hypothetical protein [Planctomycetota bacterium]
RPEIAPQTYQDRRFLLSEWVVMTSTVAVRRDTASGAGAFVDKLYSCSDYEWFWRVICIARRVKYVPVPLTIVHDGPLGMARALREQSRIRDNLRAMASSIRWMEARPETASKCSVPLRRWRAREFKQLVRLNIDQRRYPSAVSELSRYLAEYISGRFLYLPVSRKAR